MMRWGFGAPTKMYTIYELLKLPDAYSTRSTHATDVVLVFVGMAESQYWPLEVGRCLL